MNSSPLCTPRSALVLLLGALMLTAVFGAGVPRTAFAAHPPPSAPPPYAPERLSPAEAEADAVRLLEQSTWGPNDALLAHVKAVGVARFVDEQLAAPQTKYTAFAPWPTNRPDTCVDNRTLPLAPTSFCARDNYTLFQLQREFFRNAISAPDQLRQRVAFALSQLVVVSGTEISLAYAMQRYQQMLADLAFGNFRNLLTQVTLSPAMGSYLDMANNVKPNATTGVEPNENYARELLQLFSIGTAELKLDGTPLKDPQGKPRGYAVLTPLCTFDPYTFVALPCAHWARRAYEALRRRLVMNLSLFG